MAFHRGPHIREIFVAKDDIAAKRFQYEQKETKSLFNIKSKGKDKTQENAKSKHTKLLSYKPKILAESEEANVPIPGKSESISPKPDFNGNYGGAYIMGDKDVPLVLHPLSSDSTLIDDEEEDLLRPEENEQVAETSNPIFNISKSAPDSKVVRGSKVIQEDTEIIDGVVIPPPDYDEEIATMNLYEEIRERVDFNKPVCREYGGEDFSKFLEDDDIEQHGGLTWHTQRPASRNPLPEFEKKAKTEVKRGNRYQKREAKRSSDKKSKGNTQRRNSLRNFTYADSKFVNKDTVRSSNGKSKKEVEYSVYGDADNFVDSRGQSYENFLQRRHGDISPPTYSDNERNTGGEAVSPSSKDGNFWKRLTLRFKRQSSYSMQSGD